MKILNIAEISDIDQNDVSYIIRAEFTHDDLRKMQALGCEFMCWAFEGFLIVGGMRSPRGRFTLNSESVIHFMVETLQRISDVQFNEPAVCVPVKTIALERAIVCPILREFWDNLKSSWRTWGIQKVFDVAIEKGPATFELDLIISTDDPDEIRHFDLWAETLKQYQEEKTTHRLFYIEETDTFCGERNYSYLRKRVAWAPNIQAVADSELHAFQVHADYGDEIEYHSESGLTSIAIRTATSDETINFDGCVWNENHILGGMTPTETFHFLTMVS